MRVRVPFAFLGGLRRQVEFPLPQFAEALNKYGGISFRKPTRMGDGACNDREYLTRTDPQRGDDAWRISIRKASEGMQIWFPQIANRSFEVQWTTNLADRSSWQGGPRLQPAARANASQILPRASF